MALVLNYVPYELKVNAKDLASGKKISNSVYYRSADAGTGYGTPITGTSDAVGVAAFIAGVWTFFLTPLLNVNYQLTSVVSRAIIGRQYPTPMISITGVSYTLTATRIITALAHGLTTGQSVLIQGVSSPTTLNAAWTNITVITPTEIEISHAPSSPWAGGGTVQQVAGVQEFLYSNKLEVIDTTAGSITGDMMPIFSTLSVRRLNTGVGKNWRQRISVSCLNESQQVNGRLTTAALTAFTTACAGLDASVSIGGGQQWYSVAVSKLLAFGQTSPFTSSTPWTQPVTDFAPQPNLGSMTRRKPRLTQVIT